MGHNTAMTEQVKQPHKFTIRKAERSKVKLRIGLSGPSGSGKTYSALLIARGLTDWEKVGIIDTENGSADLYGHLGPYNVLTLEKPFHPDRYIEAVEALEQMGMEVIIIDSITHEWSGAGGVLELQEKLGGTFRDWAKVTPIHNRFIQAIVQSKSHIITTVRSKTDYSMNQDGGKTKVEKVGLKQETRDGFEYELTLSLDINVNHLAESSKDRTGLFKGGSPFTITEETGQKLLAWTNEGVDHIEEIFGLLDQKGKDLDVILNHYKVFSLDELSYAQIKGTIQKLRSLPDKEEVKPAEKPAEEKKATEEKDVKKKTEKQEEEINLDEADAAIEERQKESQKSLLPKEEEKKKGVSLNDRP